MFDQNVIVSLLLEGHYSWDCGVRSAFESSAASVNVRVFTAETAESQFCLYPSTVIETKRAGTLNCETNSLHPVSKH